MKHSLDPHYDVIVSGGGVAGICAAIQAARAGASVLLVEASQQLGGNLTSAGIDWPGLFHAWGKQVIAGIGWELVEKCTNLDGNKLPDFSKPTGPSHWFHQIIVSAPLFLLLAEETLAESGAELIYGSSISSATRNSQGGWDISLTCQGDTHKVTCSQIIDATGNGDTSCRLGAAMLCESDHQPGSFRYTFSKPSPLLEVDEALIEAKYNGALANGFLLTGDIRGGAKAVVGFLRNGVGFVHNGSFANYVPSADNSTAILRTMTNMNGRAAALRVFRFLRSLGADIHFEYMSPEVGVRETRRVKGRIVISQDEYTSGRIWEDSLCYAFYPVDMHIAGKGVQPSHLKEGIVATVPLRALLPEGIDDLLVAGRCISADRGALSALRVEATCMATGQVCGAAAALAATRRCHPSELPVEDIKSLLRKHGAIVPAV